LDLTLRFDVVGRQADDLVNVVFYGVDEDFEKVHGVPEPISLGGEGEAESIESSWESAFRKGQRRALDTSVTLGQSPTP
jgi:hypothetical protein